MAPPHYIGLFGLGCVARGVITILRARNDGKVHWLCYVRDNGKPRLTTEDETAGDITIVDTPQKVLKDGRVQMIVELMGGSDGLAWEVVSECLEKGIPIVTANKALIAKHMREIDDALLKVTPTGTWPVLRCEGAVCGGVPILKCLLRYHDLVGDAISSITGIVNGSTNYLLTAMENDAGKSMKEVIASMQKMGYLEADYTFDLNGSDARHKICILTRIGLGIAVDESDCFTMGLPSIIKEDFAFAKSQCCSLKLLGTVVRTDNTVRLSVLPTFVPLTDPIAHVKGADNMVRVRSRFLGDLILQGSGAGGLATGMAVAADVLELVEGCTTRAYQYCSPFPIEPAVQTRELGPRIINVGAERRNWIVRLNGAMGGNMEDGWQIVGSVGENEVYVKVHGTHGELTGRLKEGVVFAVWGGNDKMTLGA